jgi:hypothetical protein
VAASVVLPLGMTARRQADGVLQRLMFAVALRLVRLRDD